MTVGTGSDEVRVGIIGTGFGARVVAPSFEDTEGCRVVDVVSARDDEAVRTLCARADLDLVSVHSPPFLHLDHVGAAIGAGHAVLCDKPFGRNANDAREMLDVALAAGVVHLVNFEMRYDPLRLRLRELMEAGEIGELEHVHLSTFLSVSRSPLRPFGWASDAELGGGWLGALGSHWIDFIRWSMGEIVEGSAELRTAVRSRPDADGHPHRCSAEDGFAVVLATETGVTVSLDSTSVSPVTLAPALTLIGARGVLEMLGEQRIVVRKDGEVREDLCLSEGVADLGVPMRRWAAHVRDSVRCGVPEPGAPTFADGLACREVLDNLLRDGRDG
jgi:predicted dehydrogenase